MIIIKVPSLNERADDVVLLVDKFLNDIASDYGTRKKEIKKEAIELLEKNNWTGNIRELRNVVERLVIMSEGAIGPLEVKKYL